MTVSREGPGSQPSINFILDGKGDEWREGRFASDTYESRPDLLDWGDFFFDEIPPLDNDVD